MCASRAKISRCTLTGSQDALPDGCGNQWSPQRGPLSRNVTRRPLGLDENVESVSVLDGCNSGVNIGSCSDAAGRRVVTFRARDTVARNGECEHASPIVSFWRRHPDVKS